MPRLIALLSRMGLNEANVLITFTTLTYTSTRMSLKEHTRVPRYLNLETHSTTSPCKATAGRGGALLLAHTHMK